MRAVAAAVPECSENQIAFDVRQRTADLRHMNVAGVIEPVVGPNATHGAARMLNARHGKSHSRQPAIPWPTDG